MKYFTFVLLVCSCLVSSSMSLNCHQGEERIHEFAKSVGGETVPCNNTEPYCLRMESTGTQFSFPVNVTAMICATQDICDNQSCYELSTRILEMASNHKSDDNNNNMNSEYDDEILFFSLKDCQIACCQEDNCNYQPIASFRRSSPLVNAPAITEETLRESSSESEENFETTRESLLGRFSIQTGTGRNGRVDQVTLSTETTTQGAGHTRMANSLLLSALSLMVAMLLMLP